MASGQFATTRWTLVAQVRGGGSDAAASAMASLCEAYWRPLYAYARRSGHTEADAEDAVQGFFATLLDADGVSQADPAKGRFRSWLMGAFRHHLSHQRERDAAQKRGGGVATIALDVREAERWLDGVPASADAPDRAFDRAWACAVLDRVRGRLRGEFASRDRAAVWEALAPHLGAGGDPLSHAASAAALDMSEVAVKVTLHRLRGRFRELLRDEISQTLDEGDDLDTEIRHLIDSL